MTPIRTDVFIRKLRRSIRERNLEVEVDVNVAPVQVGKEYTRIEFKRSSHLVPVATIELENQNGQLSQVSLRRAIRKLHFLADPYIRENLVAVFRRAAGIPEMALVESGLRHTLRTIRKSTPRGYKKFYSTNHLWPYIDPKSDR